MDTTLKNKIVLGSTLKALKEASIYGELCPTDISLLKIILELKNYCELNLSFDNSEKLGVMARKLQNKSKHICNYKNVDNNTNKFIN